MYDSNRTCLDLNLCPFVQEWITINCKESTVFLLWGHGKENLAPLCNNLCKNVRIHFYEPTSNKNTFTKKKESDKRTKYTHWNPTIIKNHPLKHRFRNNSSELSPISSLYLLPTTSSIVSRSAYSTEIVKSPLFPWQQPAISNPQDYSLTVQEGKEAAGVWERKCLHSNISVKRVRNELTKSLSYKWDLSQIHVCTHWNCGYRSHEVPGPKNISHNCTARQT